MAGANGMPGNSSGAPRKTRYATMPAFTATLAQLYFDVTITRKDLNVVASEWLKSVGLVAS